MRIELSHIKKGLELEIKGEDKTLFEISDEDVMQYGEAKIQLIEGCSYEYQFSDETVKFKEGSKRNIIVAFSKFGKYKGTLNPNIYVGTHLLEIENSTLPFPLEVRSIKSEYRSDYRYMIESITEKCTDLIMQIDSPINQHFETNFDQNSQTLYQRFSFVKALLDSLEFEEAIQKIVSNPTTKWQENQEVKDIRKVRRFNQNSIKQIANKRNRVELGDDHLFYKNHAINSIPTHIDSSKKTESIDTNENRFIKHALEEFLFFCENCDLKFEKYSTARTESRLLVSKLSTFLNQSFFKQISRPSSLKINSPVLQRKSGYREVLNSWLKFDLAAKLIWKGGDNVYDAGKKDIATLYEYWLFFVLLDLLKEIFEIEPKSITELLQFDNGHLSLNLKQGNSIALKGIFKSPTRNLNIQFSYNRSFGGGKIYPLAGSYTTTLRPDYTLSIWPEEISKANDAEVLELITHIHFDAKYKVNNFYKLISESNEVELTNEESLSFNEYEKNEIKKGTFKNQDLIKMHAYKDAIRRTGGAYILYPGEGGEKPFRGFHELIPGLGAFVIRPKKEENDINHLKSFINQVVSNFIDRASQREYTAIKVYDIHKNNKLDSDIFNELLPEYISSKKVIPSEIFVLIGYYKDNNHLNWILEQGLYNVRYGDKYVLNAKEINAQYLLLYSKDQSESNFFFKLNSIGTKIYTKSELINDLKYKMTPSQDLYLVYKLEKECEKEFKEINIDLSKINGLGMNKRPLAINIQEFMKAKK